MLEAVVERWSIHALIKSCHEIELTRVGGLQLGGCDAIYALDVMSGGKCLLFAEQPSVDSTRPFTTLEVEMDCDGDELLFMGLIAHVVFVKGRHDFNPDRESVPFGMEAEEFDEFFTNALASWELHVAASRLLGLFTLPSLRLNRQAGAKVWVCGPMWLSRGDIERRTDGYVELENEKALLKGRGVEIYEIEVVQGPHAGASGFVAESTVRGCC